MIGLQAAVRLKIGEMGWSAKEVYSQGGEHADHARPSCSCATRNAGRMASSIATGALSRTRGSPGPRGAVARAVLGRDQQHQELAWRRSIEVLEEGAAQPRTLYNSPLAGKPLQHP